MVTSVHYNGERNFWLVGRGFFLMSWKRIHESTRSFYKMRKFHYDRGSRVAIPETSGSHLLFLYDNVSMSRNFSCSQISKKSI